MFDIGIGEILVLGVIGLLVFGPEKLPRAAADLGRWVRSLRNMASSARRDLADSAGVDVGEAMSTLRDLHPRAIASKMLGDDDGQRSAKPRLDANEASAARPAYDPDAT